MNNVHRGRAISPQGEFLIRTIVADCRRFNELVANVPQSSLSEG